MMENLLIVGVFDLLVPCSIITNLFYFLGHCVWPCTDLVKLNSVHLSVAYLTKQKYEST